MEKPKMDSNIQEELKLFRSQLFKIDVDDEESKKELSEILDRYQWDDFEPFAEEYLIAGHDIAIVRLQIFIFCSFFFNIFQFTLNCS